MSNPSPNEPRPVACNCATRTDPRDNRPSAACGCGPECSCGPVCTCGH